MTDHRISDILTLVRQQLQANGIKLWLAPYYIEGLGGSDVEIERLATTFATTLSIPAERCRMALTELQHHAVDKLRANQQFATSGLATLKVRAPVNNASNGGARFLTLETPLSVTGREFQLQIADQLAVSPANIRVINAGRFVRESETLEAQGVRNHHQVMVVMMAAPKSSAAVAEEAGAAGGSSTTASSPSDENIYEKVARARADAELLTTGHRYMEMEDQAGNTVHLPPDERRAIMLALALHEKGKAALKRAQFNEALVWLLEADEEYKRCGSQLLQSVDNWALLNLDVVWCYLCLKSVGQLPEAEQRLFICERSFKRTYGDNLNRVVALKGNAANERALIMRLHLLQAVIMYHQNRRTEAATMLLLADGELGRLSVAPEALAALCEMGYGCSEARIALRACGGSVDEALTYILRQRDERAEARRKSRAEARLRVGTSRDETWVNPRSLHALVEMGYEKRLCEVALRKANNDLPVAVDLLQHQSEQLRRQYDEDFLPDEKLVEAMVAMGFERSMVAVALRMSTNNMDKAMDVLHRLAEDGGDDDGGEAGAEFRRVMEEMAAAVMDPAAATGSSSSSSSTDATEKMARHAAKLLAERQVADEAFDRFAEDIDDAEDDHLDLPLDQEGIVLAEYKRYLNL